MHSYLIVGTFRYEQARKLIEEPVGARNRRQEARRVASRLFGARIRDAYDEVVNVINPAQDLDSFFWFVAAHPYPLPDNPTPEEKDAVAPTHLFGWVGIIPDDTKLQAFKDFVVSQTNSFRNEQEAPPITNWQESAFYRIFDIEVRSFDPIGSWENNTLVRDAKYWQERGFEIYKAQTPKEWDGEG